MGASIAAIGKAGPSRPKNRTAAWRGLIKAFYSIQSSVIFSLRVHRSCAVVSRNASDERVINMWGGIVGLIIQLISGAVGGNIAGSALKQYNLGTLGNSIAGLIGGGVGAQIIGALVGGGTGTDVAGAGGLDIGAIIGQIVAGGAGGGILMVIVGLIKQAMGGQPAS
jgi:hypothetical protein